MLFLMNNAFFYEKRSIKEKITTLCALNVILYGLIQTSTLMRVKKLQKSVFYTKKFKVTVTLVYRGMHLDLADRTDYTHCQAKA